MRLIQLWFLMAILFLISHTVSAAPPPSNQERLDEAFVSAVLNGNLKQVRHLLAQGADIDLQYGDSGTLLMMMSCAGGDEDLDTVNLTVAAELLRHHADVNATDSDGNTALMNAANTGNIQMTALLLAHHADVNAHDKEGRTALIEAAYSPGYPQIIRQLLRYHAKVNACDKHGDTPLSSVLFNNLGAARLLLDHGANPNVRVWHEKTLLVEAMDYGPPVSVKNLNHPEVLEEESIGTSMGVFGTWKTLGGGGPNYRQRIDLLLAHGADVNAADADGWTPLMRAAFWGDLSLAEVLLRHGARRDACDKTGHTALDYAQAAGHPALVRLLAVR